MNVGFLAHVSARISAGGELQSPAKLTRSEGMAGLRPLGAELIGGRDVPVSNMYSSNARRSSALAVSRDRSRKAHVCARLARSGSVSALSLRMRMSSIMRCRNGETLSVIERQVRALAVLFDDLPDLALRSYVH